jgi:hypothetical protein
MKTAIQILALLLVLVPQGRAQTFDTGDYQINRKKATPGFEVAELLAGSNITLTWNNATKTATLATGTGSTSITTLGTITTGTWNATPLADAFIASAATWNAKQAALVSGTNIKTVNGNSLLGSGNLTTAQLGALADGDTLTTGLTFPPTGLKIINDEATDYTVLLFVQGAEQTANHSINFDVMNGTRNLTLGGNLNITANATISGTNTGDQDLSTYIQDGDTLTTGLTFPFNGFKIQDGVGGVVTYSLDDEAGSNRNVTWNFGGSSKSINIQGDLTVSSAATISGTNTGDQDLSTYIQDGDTLTTGLTFPNAGGLKVLDTGASNWLAIAVGDEFTDARTLIFTVNDANRTINLSGNLTVSSAATISGTNTGDQTTITGNSGTTTAALGLKTATGTVALSTATAPSSGQVLTATSGTAANWQTPAATGVTSVTGTGTVNGLTLTGTVTSTGNLTLGGTLSGVDLATQITGTLGVANGGTGLTSAGTAGNVLTSDGTTWTSTAPATTNPAGSGSELQFRSSGTAFGAVTNSSVSGGAITLGAAEALGTTSTARLTLANTTAAAAGAQQVSPSIVLEGQAWKTTATAASQTVRFRENVLPVQGTTNPSATWQLQSEINNSGTWANRVTATSLGVLSVSGDSNTITLDAKDSNNIISATRHITITPGSGWNLLISASTQVASGNTFGFSSDVVLGRDAANILAQRNGTNAQTFRLYETDSGANDEYLEFSAASGTNLIRPLATGTGTASVVRYHTTTAVFWTSGSGSPESVVTAPVGSMYTDTAGGAATTLYVKESGTGSTGWIAK